MPVHGARIVPSFHGHWPVKPLIYGFRLSALSHWFLQDIVIEPY